MEEKAERTGEPISKGAVTREQRTRGKEPTICRRETPWSWNHQATAPSVAPLTYSPVSAYRKSSHLVRMGSLRRRGDRDMAPGLGGLKPSAVAGGPSVTCCRHAKHASKPDDEGPTRRYFKDTCIVASFTIFMFTRLCL